MTARSTGEPEPDGYTPPMRAVATESQLHTETTPPISRTVALDLYDTDSDSQCQGPDADCACAECCHSTSIFGAAACVMVDASTRAKPRTRRQRLGAQAMHWGVLFVALAWSLPMLVTVMGEGLREWTRVFVLNTWVGPTFVLGASTMFAVGFLSKLGIERVVGGCAMIRRLGPAAILGVAWSTLPSFAGVLLVLNMEPIRLALIGDGGSTLQLMMGVGIYIAAFVVLAGLGCLPTVSQAILAGYAFGLPLGFAAALIGFGGASLVGYELVQRVARKRVEHELHHSPKAMMIRDALLNASTGRALLIVSLLRSSPTAPFALTNLLLGCLGVNRWVFFFGTLIGMTPRTLAAVLIGLTFTGWNGGFDKPWWVVALGIASLVVLLIVIARVSSKALERVSRERDGAPKGAAIA